MRSAFVSTIVLSSVLALFSPQLAEARMSGQMIENNHHLHLLTKREPLAQAPAHQHRRHHVKLSKRGSCKSYSSSSNSTAPVDVTSNKVAVNNAAGSASSSSSSSSSSGSSSKSSSKSSSSSSSGSSGNKSSSSSSSSSSDSSSSSSSSSRSSSSSSSSGSSTKASGSVSAFQGVNSGIGSWFRTNSGQDSTNGQSWCQTYYQDDWPCFAPSVGAMLSSFGGDYNKAATAYCGLEAKVTDPKTGNTLTGFICDGFDDKWVLSPGSIDLTTGAFKSLYGSFDGNKNTVISGVQWELTGNVVEKGTFQNGKKW